MEVIIVSAVLISFGVVFVSWAVLTDYKINNHISYWNHLKIKHFLRRNKEVAELLVKENSLSDRIQQVRLNIARYKNYIEEGFGKRHPDHYEGKIERLEQLHDKLLDEWGEVFDQIRENEKFRHLYSKYCGHATRIAVAMQKS